MTDKQTGGQAFPRAGFSGPNSSGQPVRGMTLRDYFAGQFMSNSAAIGSPFTDLARDAYEYANAMIAARGKE